MSMKKTDMDKNMAKKLGGQLKTAAIAQRFGAGAAAVAAAKKGKPSTAARTVPVSLRLPADLAAQLRERAVGQDGGISALVAQAVAQWLATAGKTAQA